MTGIPGSPPDQDEFGDTGQRHPLAVPASRPPGIAVVTGGTLGIGAQISEQLLAGGWLVHVLARHAGDFEHVDGLRCHGHNVDVRDATTITATANRIAGLSDAPIDVLVVCAGVGFPTPLTTVSVDEYKEIFDTNVHGTIFTVTSFLPYLRDGNGMIVVISSIAGRRGFADWSVYCASKHAMEGFVNSIRDELRPRRIRVTSIQPGSVDTPSYDHLPPEAKSEFMDPATVAALVVHTIHLPAQAVVETLFINNAAGDL